MSKILVLAEKPSVGRDIARVLKCNNNKGSYIEGNKYVVTWALGHLVGLQDPEGYGDKYKDWNMESLPMLPKHMKTVVLKKTSKQFYNVKKLINREDINEIVIATDAGREGELVARWIIEKAGSKKKIKRLWISSQTNKAILEGFNNLKDGNKYNNLFRAAECRAEADWLVGLNVTRGLTCKYNAQLSAGRVQSPTLSLIVNREEEIKNFKPKEYHTITVKSDKCNFTWVNKDNNGRIFDLEFSKKIEMKLKGSNINIVNVNSKDKKAYPKALYDLTELQRDCNRLWGFSAKQTLNIMQRLYENYKILTYPRTDSRYITTDIVGTLKDRIKAVGVGEYRAICENLMKKDIKGNKSFVDNSKVSDHHAIIPTEERGNLALLSSEERKVYDLVVKRFLSHLMYAYVYVETTLEGEANGEKLIAKGKVEKEKGWKRLYEKLDEDESSDDIKEQTLPVINKGESLQIKNVEVKKNFTTPPARFNEATLLSAMENPQKYINVDKASAKTLNETGGLGTVATRADIIEKLFNSFVIEKRGKDIYPTSKGKQLIELVPEDLKSPLLTAEWERRLDAISKGKEDPNKFLKEIRNYTVALIEDVKLAESKFHHDNLTGKKCPKCGKYMLQVKGKQGEMYVCQDRECGHRENISRITNARCPECKKRLELRGSGDGKIYVCPGANCNFREKESQFKKRFEKNDKVNKREVNKIMQKMKKEANEDINNPFAALLKDFK
ncbi:DNA topoisomerase III [Clostridium thermobutyricum]|uniref:DNA topoisomerase 3 n=1 Tax=Clostridium thermobutyricum DSM 4928 TaxID=1121339 RepID=A0A1V4SPN3_9CLOT|nr:DNA topoisomerase III [Clostridium thermobutyricum]OPX45810.1 DNA topoisomerase 3 [Clostridium thermobutyricum DSM 4928]